MRKSKILLATTMCCTMLFAAGCSKKEVTDYSKHVTLGEYKGIEVTVESTEVTEEDVTKQIETTLNSAATKEDVTDRSVQTGDIVNIDYVGKVDGKKFDGGSAEKFDLTIGSKQFIDDFEDQLVGANIGDKVTVNVTFPEDYKSEDLAGKDAVFTVTINGIKETVVPKLTDKWVKKYTEKDEVPCTTVEEYKEVVKETLKTQKEESAATNKTADVLTAIVENSKINSYPEEEVDAYVADMKAYYEQIAAMNGVDFASFLSMMGMTEEQFKEEATTMAQATIARQMVCKLIAKAEGMTVTDEEYQAGLEQYAKDYSNASKEYTTEEFETEYGKELITENILLEKVLDFVTEQAVEV